LKRLPYLFIVVLFFTLSQCAKKGRPTGGPKDEDAPLFVIAEPPYESVNFNKDEIKLYFNEYIKLNDLNKQLIISPPLNPENPPLITPQGSASKYITIQILDTLKDDTTYIFDFGNSVEDNNEANKLERFKYVFSTGDYIDSLTLKGSVKNSYISENIKNIKLLLYRLDSSYQDSAVYNVKPNYVTSSLDTSNFKFTNLRKGKYYLMALKDESSDYLFAPDQDEIGFYRDTIVLPQDSIIPQEISLFKEILPYKFRRGKEERKGKLIFGYEGDAEGMQLEIMSDVPDDFKTVALFEKGADTLNLWHSPIEMDSLMFKVIKGNTIDTSVVKLRKKKLDSLTVSSTTRSYLEFNDTLFLESNNPIIKIDTSKVYFVDKDTVDVDFDMFISEKESKVGLLFEKRHQKTYTLEVYPEALQDIFNQVNDTIKLRFSTRKLEDYGDIVLNIQNPASRPVIIQLTDKKDKTIREQIIKATGTLTFKYLKPKEYKVRIIYDDNDNGKWDTGDFLKRRQPEIVEYFSDIQPVRPNWSLNEVITIKQ
jgi:uncharacterized protein (DUF2141 family)